MFLASFILLSVFSLKAEPTNTSANLHGLNFIQKEQSTPLNNLQQLSEKEENETEKDVDLELFAFIVPFFEAQISYLTFTSATLAEVNSQKVITAPAYLLNASFRI